LRYAVTKMPNGRMEGINRKIKTLLRQVYGFRDDDFLRLKLYALHESKHKPQTCRMRLALKTFGMVVTNCPK